MKSAKEMREISDKGYMNSYQEFLQKIEKGITECAERGFTSRTFTFYDRHWSDLLRYVDLMTNEMEALDYIIDTERMSADSGYIITISWA